MKHNELKELNHKELNDLYQETDNIGLKSIICLEINEKLSDELLNQIIDNPLNYLTEIEAYINSKNFTRLLPSNINLLLIMLHINFCNGDYNEYLTESLFNTPSFNKFSDNEQKAIVSTLIEKNKLKASTTFLNNKIKDNLLLAKVNEDKMQYSFGLKNIDDSLLEKLGFEFKDFLELGWVNNNGDRTEFREALSNFLNSLINQKIIALVREDNIKALALFKEYNFKEIKRIQSPYSKNILVVLQPFN
jgi:hypothetical protein